MRKIVREKIYSYRISILNADMAEKRLKEWAEQCEKLRVAIYSAVNKLITAQQMFMRFADSMYVQEITNQRRELEKAVRAYEEWLLNEKD